MSVSVTAPLDAPANVVATLQDGGSLDPNTTYYFRVAANVDAGYGPQKTTRYGAPCAEQSFTTTTTKRSALITWDPVADADAYNVYSTKVSGSYPPGNNILHGAYNQPTTLTNQYLMDAEANEYRMFDTFPLDYLPGGMDVEEGNVIVTFDGTTTLEDIANAVIAAGHSGCVHYDEQLFTLKGSLMAKSAGSGSLTALQMTIITCQGWIFDNNNDNIIMTFGEYVAGSTACRYGCTIGALAHVVRVTPSSRMKFYGCKFLRVGGGAYWIRSAIIYFYPNPDYVKECILDQIEVRAIGSNIPSGLTTNAQTSAYFTGTAENFIQTDGIMVFWSYEGQEFRGGSSNCATGWRHLHVLYNKPTSPIKFYDRDFTVAGVQTDDNLPVVYYGASIYRPIEIYHSFALVTTPGAAVVLKDKDGSTVLSETADVDGLVSAQDILAWEIEHAEDAAGTNVTEDYRGPFTLTITKDGYQDYEDDAFDLTGENDLAVKLMAQEYVYVPTPINQASIVVQAVDAVNIAVAIEDEISIPVEVEQ